ncbi:nascent polypeptide-associated complex subunit alpha, muscle-specific form-like [Eublepharis macularius]|uniref:Nascent polypeptide-associated complex subunit alpha, muscle-specific form-like n=1 Tax=Eublepharis macularius TaxID=481883 RepID=A0AA97KM79_EUBMA|nr:nascent polypeptide-associated complex subunit alpha, muscle-specific form-like [Eublepharis macularius]
MVIQQAQPRSIIPEEVHLVNARLEREATSSRQPRAEVRGCSPASRVHLSATPAGLPSPPARPPPSHGYFRLTSGFRLSNSLPPEDGHPDFRSPLSPSRTRLTLARHVWETATENASRAPAAPPALARPKSKETVDPAACLPGEVSEPRGGRRKAAAAAGRKGLRGRATPPGGPPQAQAPRRCSAPSQGTPRRPPRPTADPPGLPPARARAARSQEALPARPRRRLQRPSRPSRLPASPGRNLDARPGPEPRSLKRQASAPEPGRGGQPAQGQPLSAPAGADPGRR